MGFTPELHLCFEHKIEFYLYWEEYWGKIFQTSIDNREVDCHILFKKWEKFIPEVTTASILDVSDYFQNDFFPFMR